MKNIKLSSWLSSFIIWKSLAFLFNNFSTSSLKFSDFSLIHWQSKDCGQDNRNSGVTRLWMKVLKILDNSWSTFYGIFKWLRAISAYPTLILKWLWVINLFFRAELFSCIIVIPFNSKYIWKRFLANYLLQNNW